jgi:hypothetical protein
MTSQRPTSGSYERINYSLRPAKCIERKMMCEAFWRLFALGGADNYRYVGFGSTFFSDFLLFHRSLGIADMVSIEKDERNRERFMFNRPFSCIELVFGHSNKVLPTLSWDKPTILWLDYESKLNDLVLSDISFFCANAASRSVLVVTVNAEPDPVGRGSFDKLKMRRMRRLVKRVGEERVPPDISGADLAGWGLADICRTIIHNQIQQTLSQRNGVLATESKIQYRQLFNFHYADAMKMLTVGGLLYQHEQTSTVNHCDFGALSFVRSDDQSYLIQVPNLTLRELHHLDTYLPIDASQDLQELDTVAIPEEHVRRYAEVYRYFPTFAEIEL